MVSSGTLLTDHTLLCRTDSKKKLCMMKCNALSGQRWCRHCHKQPNITLGKKKALAKGFNTIVFKVPIKSMKCKTEAAIMGLDKTHRAMKSAWKYSEN